MPKKIELLNKIAPVGLEILDGTAYSCGEGLDNPDAVLVRSANMLDMSFAPTLKCIARAGAGVNNIPVERCSEQGIVVFNTPGANANAVKELVLAGMLLSSRLIVPSVEWVNTLKGKGEAVPAMVEKGKSDFTGPELAGKTLGIIGLGAIGVLIANAATHLDMEVLGFDPYIKVENAWKLSRSVKQAGSYKEIYEKSDYITIHAPVTPETKGLINSESISSMKTGVRILNFARGDLVVNEDIIKALESGKVSMYVTDFPCDELIGAKNVLCIPHLGASTPESEDNCAIMAAAQLKDFLENGNIKNSVNFPEAVMARSTGVRICLIHKNIPNMLSQISNVLAGAGVNIENMLNKSKKDMAYTMVDVEGEISKEIKDGLSAIDGVIRVRVI